jgi:hypothetical protein
MFTKLYLNTTNPKLSWSEFISNIPSISGAIIINTFIYTIFFNLVSYIFIGTIFSRIINIRFVSVLIIIMILGYIGRFLHSKEVYKSFNGNVDKTSAFMDGHYNSWIFMG